MFPIFLADKKGLLVSLFVVVLAVFKGRGLFTSIFIFVLAVCKGRGLLYTFVVVLAVCKGSGGTDGLTTKSLTSSLLRFFNKSIKLCYWF